MRISNPKMSAEHRYPFFKEGSTGRAQPSYTGFSFPPIPGAKRRQDHTIEVLTDMKFDLLLKAYFPPFLWIPCVMTENWQLYRPHLIFRLTNDAQTKL